jgi:methylamine dehydrogenase heavy chain
VIRTTFGSGPFLLAVGLAAALIGTATQAQNSPPPPLQAETLTVEALSEHMQPHWVWVNDLSFDRMLDGRAYLIDADAGKMLGMVSGGYGHGTLMIAPDGRTFAVPSLFLSRGTRGARTDIVTFYATKDLTPGQEIEIPPKRFSGVPFLASAPVMPGGRYGLIYNFTPAQSVTVIDMAGRRTVGEYDTPGCGLIYPTSAVSFFMICSDGTLQAASVGADGAVTLGKTTANPMFPSDDPATEKAVFTGREWLFFTYAGKVIPVTGKDGAAPSIGTLWALTGEADSGWRPGGLQPAAYHAGTNRLYVLMHQGGPGTHKDPGTEIWVYDVAKRQRTLRIPLETPATSIAISGDEKPLLYLVALGETALRVHDAGSGKALRRIEGLGPTMTVIQPAPMAQAAGR